MSELARAEMQALTTRAGVLEAARQAALQRGDRQTADDAAAELARLHARHCDLEQQAERVA